MRSFLRLRTARWAIAAALACAAVGRADDATDAAAALHARLFTLDTHVDVAETIGSDANDTSKPTSNQVDLPKMRAGGLDAAFFILYSQQGPLTREGYAAARATVEAKYQGVVKTARAHPDQIVLATTSDEARAAAAEGKLVAFLGMENAYPLGESLADVPLWAERGVRYMGITHFGHNQFGDSANPRTEAGEPESRWGGLSPLGEELVAAINRAGMLVDVSHAGRATMMDAVALSKAPVIASHSGVAAVNANPRNLDDEQLRAIAANGGVAQIVAYAAYLRPAPPERTAAVAALRQKLGVTREADLAALAGEARAAWDQGLAEIEAKWPQATVSDFADHIDHAVEVAGIDHVGIASDFDGGGGVTGWMDASQTAAVTAELVRRGYSEEDLGKIWSGNLLRALDDAQAVGRRLRGEE